MRSDDAVKELQFWSERLTGELPLLQLPADRPHPPVPTMRGVTIREVLTPAACAALRSLANASGTTVARLLLAVYAAWLHRIAGQSRLIVGMPTHGLPDAPYAQVVGHFVNPVAIRTDYDPDATLPNWVARVSEDVAAATAHARCPFASVVEHLQPQRTAGRTPVFQTLFNYIGGGLGGTRFDQLDASGLTLVPLHVPQQEGQFEIVLEVAEIGDAFRLDMKFATDIFLEATGKRLAASFSALLADALDKPRRSLRALAIVPAAQRECLRAWGTGPTLAVEPLCVHELIARQCAETPDAIATVGGDAALTYRELDDAADRLAMLLRQRGVGAQTPVALHLDRSTWLLVSLLGVFKCGGIAVPLNVNEPVARLSCMLDDVRPAVVLTNRWRVSGFAQTGVEAIAIEDLRQEIASLSSVLPPARTELGTVAYILYTSGSTGQPKGVMVEHRNLANLIASMRRDLGITPADTMLAVTALTFDISFLELLLPLCVGARVVIASRSDAVEPERLGQRIEQSGATFVQATPSHWAMLIEAGWQGRRTLTALCGGEMLPRGLADALLARCGAVWNLYGPTETTIWSTAQRLEKESGPVMIGRPIANTTVVLLDAHGLPVPVGCAGELFIAGEGVARGYLNRAELTSQRFISRPGPDRVATRFYRTGDLCRWTAGGALEFLGRGDHQVKIRGHRVELGEIESVLRAHPGVGDAAVVVSNEASGHPKLIAHWRRATADQGVAVNAEALRLHLRQSLPDHMVPAAMMEHAAFPLTPHGKLDRGALAQLAPAPQHDETAYVAPRNPLEAELCRLFEEVLGVAKVGTFDNFFDLGGNSISAVRLAARASGALRTNIPVARLFAGQTPAEMASALDASFTIDWQAEAALPSDTRIESPGRPAGPPREVLLTGATGFLGAHMLRDLIDRTSALVVCLVRAQTEAAAMQRLQAAFAKYRLGHVDTARVSAVCGDLDRAGLGLDRQQIVALSERVDQIIHAAAWVNFAYPYAVLRRANVEATRDLIGLACRGKTKDFVFVSSLTVLDVAGRAPSAPPDEEARPGAPDLLPTGYAQSKAVAEMLLREAAAAGLTVTVVRTGVISGSDTTGAWTETQWGRQALRAAALLGRVPEEFLNYEIALSPVNAVSRAVVAIAGEEGLRGRVFHIPGTPWKLGTLFDRYPGPRPQPLPYEQWIAGMRTAAERDGSGELRGLLLVLDGNIQRGTERAVPPVKARRTRDDLASVAVPFPETTDATIDLYWRSLAPSAGTTVHGGQMAA
jgi:amino acid adenylation domain-containing protein/thioester reductase-like protein